MLKEYTIADLQMESEVTEDAFENAITNVLTELKTKFDIELDYYDSFNIIEDFVFKTSMRFDASGNFIK